MGAAIGAEGAGGGGARLATVAGGGACLAGGGAARAGAGAGAALRV